MTHRINQYHLGEKFLLNGLALRPADEAECRRWGHSPDDMIQHSIKHSAVSYGVVAYEQLKFRGEWIDCPARPLALWGYGSTSPMSDTCNAWLLTFPEIEKHKIAFIRSSRKGIAFLLEVYHKIEILVDSEHSESIKWLTWLGFKQLAEVRSPAGHLFFTMQRAR